MSTTGGTDTEIERMIAAFDHANRAEADYPARLVRLAEVVIKEGHKLRGFQLCRQALAQAPGDAELNVRVRRLVSALIPPYHLGMMGDTGRTDAWERALRRVIRPDSYVFEVGTGGGMLALLAARAGAARVTTCESDPVLAAVAAEIVEQNGFSDRIRVINKPVAELTPGVDLDAPADVFCFDIFGDRLLDFDPLTVLRDARRLLAPEARFVPEVFSLHVALAHWGGSARRWRLGSVSGFDLRAMEIFVPASLPLPSSDAGLAIRSAPAEVFRFESKTATPEGQIRVRVRLEAGAGGPVSGVVQWIRLGLTDDIMLETKPRSGSTYFGTPRFWPWAHEIEMRAGEARQIEIECRGTRVVLWDRGSPDVSRAAGFFV